MYVCMYVHFYTVYAYMYTGVHARACVCVKLYKYVGFFILKNISISLKRVLNMLSSVIMSCDIYQLTDCALKAAQPV